MQNTKTPEEIKKGLKCDGTGDCTNTICPYFPEKDCLHSRHFDALALIQQLESAQPKWISVEDRLPEKGQKVLVCGVKKGMQVGAFRGFPAPSRSRLWWWKKNTLIEVTHWMPLPEPPKEEPC